MAAARAVPLAMIYTDWFAPVAGIPADWTLVGRLFLGRAMFSVGSNPVDFYLPPAGDADEGRIGVARRVRQAIQLRPHLRAPRLLGGSETEAQRELCVLGVDPQQRRQRRTGRSLLSAGRLRSSIRYSRLRPIYSRQTW